MIEFHSVYEFYTVPSWLIFIGTLIGILGAIPAFGAIFMIFVHWHKDSDPPMPLKQHLLIRLGFLSFILIISIIGISTWIAEDNAQDLANQTNTQLCVDAVNSIEKLTIVELVNIYEPCQRRIKTVLQTEPERIHNSAILALANK